MVPGGILLDAGMERVEYFCVSVPFVIVRAEVRP